MIMHCLCSLVEVRLVRVTVEVLAVNPEVTPVVIDSALSIRGINEHVNPATAVEVDMDKGTVSLRCRKETVPGVAHFFLGV
jgi:hypothetical protein